jgi:hypothetical protein
MVLSSCKLCSSLKCIIAAIFLCILS